MSGTLGVGVHRTRIERRRIDVHAGTGLHHIGDDQPDDQRQRREEEEIDEGLAGDPPDRAQLLHPGNTGHQGQEDDRRDDHLDQLDEAVAERFQRLPEDRPEMPDQRPEQDRGEHLHVKMPGEPPTWACDMEDARNGRQSILPHRHLSRRVRDGILGTDRFGGNSRTAAKRLYLSVFYHLAWIFGGQHCAVFRTNLAEDVQQSPMARRVSALMFRPGRSFVLAAAGSIVALALFGFAVSRWAAEHAMANAGLGASQMARAQAGLLASELQKFRLLPLVLTEYPDVRMVLEAGEPAAVARLNGKLELLSSRTDAAAIYVIDRNGRTLAASNWRLPTSFVGQVYGFRPYFQDAMRSGAAELFALGTVSGRPGLFIARRVESEGTILGVIVVKVEFDRLEAAWARQPGPTFVTDRHGVIIITSRADWRFRSTRALGPGEIAQIRSARQFGNLPLPPLGLVADGAALREGNGRASGRFLQADVPTGLEGGTLHYLGPLAAEEASAAATARAAILAALVIVLIALAWLYRAREKRQLQDAARRALESEVALRTAELRETNERLTDQSRERERADRRYRSAREELAQANRLGSIGQITAGVAHEINQPVSAIRTFAENAGTFLDQDKPERARKNLGLIVELTARIGAITAELRGFARRGAPAIDAVEIAPVIDGALLLIGDRVRAVGATVEREGEQAGIRVVADRVRLEQIIINLLQNALDALEGRDDPRIRVSTVYAERVTVEIDDNGPGIPAAIADQLFTPFVTGKPDGLGLGLGIARDIAREFGGDLDLTSSALGGTAFHIVLRRA